MTKICTSGSPEKVPQTRTRTFKNLQHEPVRVRARLRAMVGLDGLYLTVLLGLSSYSTLKSFSVY